MATTRSGLELIGLEVEAERLVREGYSRAEVSRMLGVSAATLSQWALRGRWRKKDLEYEGASSTIDRLTLKLQEARRAAASRQAERIAQLKAMGVGLKGAGAQKLIEAMAEQAAMAALPAIEHVPVEVEDFRQYRDD